MKEASKGNDRRISERRLATAERRSDPVRAVVGDRRVAEGRGVGEAMVDALEHILEWERASERTLRAARSVESGEPS